jgi:hypothetical protein
MYIDCYGYPEQEKPRKGSRAQQIWKIRHRMDRIQDKVDHSTMMSFLGSLGAWDECATLLKDEYGVDVYQEMESEEL